MQAIAQAADDDQSAMNVECVAEGKALLRIRGLRFTPLPDEDAGSQSHTDGAYLQWRPDFDFVDEATALVKPPSDTDGTHLLEEFALLCILDSAARLRGQSPASPQMERYGKWISMKADMARSPVIGDISELLSLSGSERLELIAAKHSRLLETPSRAAYAAAIAQIHDNIEGLYNGSVDASQLLMANNILPNIYTAINFGYAPYIRLMSNSRPTLRILEIGAGAGGTTESILSQITKHGNLAPYSVYTYTDISAGFFPQARERFRDAPNVEYKVFDITRDPFAQEFEAGYYDIILAPYVVHATPYLRQTLKNLNAVLKTDGRLLLSEPATVGVSPNFIFGTFASWWSGDGDGRKWEPFVSNDRWDADLKAAGFTGAANVVDDAPFPYRYWSTIITQPAVPIPNEKNTPVAVVTDDLDSKLTSDIATGLAESNHMVMKQLLTDNIAKDHNVVFVLDLEKPFFKDISSQNWATFQSFMNNCESTASRKMLWILPPAQKNCKSPESSLSIGLLRSVRAELGCSLTTLEIDPADPELTTHVVKVFNKIIREHSDEKLLPDNEFLVDDGIIKIGRFTPFSIDSELLRVTHDASCEAFTKLKKPLSVPLDTANGSVNPQPIITSLNFDPESSYIVTGGLGGLGRAICSWMVERGARFITTISRSGGDSADDKLFVTEMRDMGCDALFPDMTHEEWMEALLPKVDGCWNLHHALQDVTLDFFVVTSSIVATINVPGQANYNAANTYLEAFCQYRNGLGLAASAIAVSPIDDVGVVVENDKARRNLSSNGLQFLTEREALEYIHLAILHQAPMPIIMGLHSRTHLDDDGNHCIWKKDRRMGFYHNIVKEMNIQDESSADNKLRDFLTNATASPSELESAESIAFLSTEIGKRAYSFMLKPIEEVDISLSLVDVGLDSLMAVEMRRVWNQMFGLSISVFEIMSLGALENFGRLAAQGLKQKLMANI
ncbi:hypothetical protein F4680DRAFT_464043 [Xylaria scruposa]|nr:hypothetical protein F4680DRAFT_464043 [Xylaria scruposa]